MKSRASLRKRSTSGFTLIEVMLAVFIMSLTAMIFAAAFPTAQISRIKSAHMSYAVNLARQSMEEQRAGGYSNLIVGDTNSVPSELPGGAQTISITQYATNIKKLSVTVTWEGYRRVGGATTLVTLVSNHG